MSVTTSLDVSPQLDLKCKECCGALKSMDSFHDSDGNHTAVEPLCQLLFAYLLLAFLREKPIIYNL
jgi:hypothetical protein